MAKKADKTLSGRAVPNEQGDVRWEWQTDATVDTLVVHSLGAGLELDGTDSPQSGRGTNPYDQPPNANAAKSRRRTLDDMRLLSEGIKRSKSDTKE